MFGRMRRAMSVCRRVVGGAIIAGMTLWGSALHAQAVLFDGPTSATLPTLTPQFQLRALGFGGVRPLQVTVQISTTLDFAGPLALDSVFLTNDTILTVQVTRPLPSDAPVYWRARVSPPGGLASQSPTTGPRLVPAWLTLVRPNSVSGNIDSLRRPEFVWRSARVLPALGNWKYDIEITSEGRTEQVATALTDTVWRPNADLQANTRYRWNVRASLANGSSILVHSNATFFINDPAVPARTLLYQSFPNPFPSPIAFATCIWFDVAAPGARLSLDVTDLRGNLVRTLIPGSDGIRDFAPGRYGRGLPGAQNNCDNRFVWDATGNDGRTVAAGVYILRFQAGRAPPRFVRMLFLGR